MHKGKLGLVPFVMKEGPWIRGRVCQHSPSSCGQKNKKIKAVVSTLKEAVVWRVAGVGEAFLGNQSDHGQPRQKKTSRAVLPSLLVCASGMHAWKGALPPVSWTCPRGKEQREGQQRFCLSPPHNAITS